MTAEQEQSREIFFEGIDHFEAGRLTQARACFERCLALTPGRPSVLGNLGITLFRLGQSHASVAYLLEATAAEPQFGEAWATLGLAHEAHGDWAQAIDALKKALEFSDRSAALWFSLGQCATRLARQVEALKAFDRALALDPAFAVAWSVRGGLLREMGELDTAAQSFERAMALGADPELHAYYLASVRGGLTPPTAAPRQYVEALFDDYAADFQGHLVEQLGYRGHEVLLRPLLNSGRRFRRVLDLGCGTGLCAPLLHPVSDLIVGVDLSSAMLGQAAKLGLYRELVHADLGEYLSSTPHRADLVVAADVLIYVGEPSAVFRDVARILEPDGLFAFTVELPSNGADLQLLSSLRYAHSEVCVRRLAAACGLDVADLRQAPIRHEQTKPVPGLYITLRRRGTESASA